MSKRLSVWLADEHVGTLAQDKSGRMSFAYEKNTLPAISLSMPVREEPYGHDLCESFFGGLLPESDHARQLIGRRFGVNGNNSYSLLSVIGHECAGAISIFADDESRPTASPSAKDSVLTEKELARHIRELPKRPLLAGIEGIRLSLAGAGDKAAVCVVDGKVALPADGAPTSHILKPNIGDVGNTVANEFFCMKLASRMRLATAEVELLAAEDIDYLLVKRYDRGYDSNGNMTRLHQEDFCQSLGIVSAQKYQNEGGPGYKDCFDLLRRVSRPAIDRNRMTAYLLFNYLIGNMDAHGKNFSLLHVPSLTMAPLYDVLATRIYPDLSARLAMRVDKYYEADKIFPRHWRRLCEACGLAYPGFKRAFLDSCQNIAGTAEELRDDLAKQSSTQAKSDRAKSGHGQTYDLIVQHIHESAQTASKRLLKEAD